MYLTNCYLTTTNPIRFSKAKGAEYVFFFENEGRGRFFFHYIIGITVFIAIKKDLLLSLLQTPFSVGRLAVTSTSSLLSLPFNFIHSLVLSPFFAFSQLSFFYPVTLKLSSLLSACEIFTAQRAINLALKSSSPPYIFLQANSFFC